jgi:hypothetical protein
VQALLLWLWLGKKLPSLRLREIALSGGRTLLAAGAAVVLGRLAAGAISGRPGALGAALPGLVGALVFISAFFVLALGLRSDELLLVLRPLQRRFVKKPAA